jgi:hypothetical protein
VKKLIVVLAVSALVFANGCFLFKKPTKDGTKPPADQGNTTTPHNGTTTPNIVKPEIPAPDAATAEKIGAALKRFADASLTAGERQDALLVDAASLGTISYGAVLGLLGNPQINAADVPKIFKFFSQWPDKAERDKALVTHLFNDDGGVRAGAQKALAMLYPDAKIAYDPAATEQQRYEKILEWKKALKME